MPLPAIAAALARFAPLLAEATSSASAASAAGGAAAGTTAGSAASAGGGFSSILGRLFSSPQAFGSSQELGSAVQRLEDIAALTQTLREQSAVMGQEQSKTAARFREDERLYMMGSPDDTRRLSELEKQRAANAKQQADIRREAAQLESRVRATTQGDRSGGFSGLLGTAAAGAPLAAHLLGGPPPAASRDLAGQLTGSMGDVATAPLGPLGGLVRKLPMFQAMGNLMQARIQPFADLGVDRAEGQVAGSAASYAAQGAQIAMNPMTMLRGEGFAHAARLPGLIKEWGEALVESKRGIAQFNGQIAMAFAEAEHRGIIRAVQSGERTAGATSGLSDALQDLYDQVQPMKDTVTIVLSTGVEALVRGVSLGLAYMQRIYEVLKLFNPLLDAVEEGVDLLGTRGIEGKAHPIDDWIRDTKNRDLGGRPKPGR
jgi:hypothetical protein